jgi:hypothetical protein
MKFIYTFTLVLMTLWAQAQVTTSSMSGLVLDNSKESMIGATVTATHIPSGTVYSTITREDGRFNLIGLRVGGPYSITTSYVGYKDLVQENIFLNLGQNYVYNPTVTEDVTLLDELTVIANKNSILNDKRTGASTNISAQNIATMPTLDRSIGNFTRLTPQANGRSFGGADNRFNNITLDGSIFNNSFGLSDLPGGQTASTPISLDAIEQIQVNLAPYDVRESGFTGAGINAVTKSGTNEFSGSVFFNNRNEAYLGKKAAGVDVIANDFNVSQVGFRFGGPLIKNKLFFFINGEAERRTDPASQFTATNGDTGPTVSRVLQKDLDDLRSYLVSKFNYDPGRYQDYSLNTQSNKATARFDYNVSNKSKFSLRYNFLKSSRDVLPSNSGSFQNRTNNGFGMAFESSNYVINNDLNSFIAEHNYTGTNYANKIIAGFTANRDYRTSISSTFPLVDILSGGRNYITFGYEPFTPNNRLDTDTWQLRNDFSYYVGKSTITAGVNLEAFEFRNTFTPTYYGQYVYSSLQDFYNDTDTDTSNDPTLRRYTTNFSNLEGRALPTATTKATSLGLYIQDEIQASNDFKVTLGFRVDYPIFANTALNNSQVEGYTFRDRNGDPLKLNTSKLPNTNPLFSPRVGFNWDVKGDRSLQLRGGTGIFSGRPAFVWLSNQIGNNGILQGNIFENDVKGKYPFSTDVTKYYLEPKPGQPAASYNIAVTDPNFKFPQVWRTNLAIDKELPYGLIGSLEGIYSYDINNIDYINANFRAPVGVVSAQDQRPRYGNSNATNRVNGNITDAIYMSNNSGGNTYSITAKLEKPVKNGLGGMLAYNYGRSRDYITAGSIAFSSWRDNVTTSNNNLVDLSNSGNDLRHRLIGALSYRIEYAKILATQISLFGQYQNQSNLSYVVNGDMNGDQIQSNDLIFVPNSAAELNFEEYKITVAGADKVFTVRDQQIAFDNYIDQDNYLSTRRGKYAERNGLIRPMLATIDLSIVQDIFKNIGGKKNSLQLRFDIFNIGNLFSDDWGVGDRVITNAPLRFSKIDATTKAPIYRFENFNNELIKTTYIKSSTLSDVWQMQLGVRYTYN